MTVAEIIDRAKAEIGYPVIKHFPLKDEDIKESCVSAAVIEYFKRKPIKAYRTYAAGSIVDFADLPTNTFGIMEAQYVPEMAGGIDYDNVFALANHVVSGFGVGSRNGNAIRVEDIYTKWAAQSMAQSVPYAIIYDEEKRQVKLYVRSGTSGNFSLGFGTYGDATQVRWEDTNDFIKLVSAYLMRKMADIFGMIEMPAEVKIDATLLRDRALEIDDPDTLNARWASPDTLVMWR